MTIYLVPLVLVSMQRAFPGLFMNSQNMKKTRSAILKNSVSCSTQRLLSSGLKRLQFLRTSCVKLLLNCFFSAQELAYIQ